MYVLYDDPIFFDLKLHTLFELFGVSLELLAVRFC